MFYFLNFTSQENFEILPIFTRRTKWHVIFLWDAQPTLSSFQASLALDERSSCKLFSSSHPFYDGGRKESNGFLSHSFLFWLGFRKVCDNSILKSNIVVIWNGQLFFKTSMSLEVFNPWNGKTKTCMLERLLRFGYHFSDIFIEVSRRSGQNKSVRTQPKQNIRFVFGMI